MRGMRNRMAHGYFDIDFDIVWNTLQHALPDLERKILSIKHELARQEEIDPDEGGGKMQP